MTAQARPLQPILVVLDYRGADRFRRALESVADAQHLFSRVVLSVTAAEDSEDMSIAREFSIEHPGAEVICPGRELPTMQHQAFWIDHLERTGASRTDWIYWLAYDDQIRRAGIEAMVDEHGNWPLHPGTAYFGPWAMRHEQPEETFDGPWDEPLESWTSFPSQGPTRLPVARWIADQLRQPTYIQMSGSVCTFESHRSLIRSRPAKNGPMRIEMATAAAPCNAHVEEFSGPVSIVYGRSNSDRASYGKAARKEDVHLMAWLARYSLHHPMASAEVARAAMHGIGGPLIDRLGRRRRPQEEWRVRAVVRP